MSNFVTFNLFERLDRAILIHHEGPASASFYHHLEQADTVAWFAYAEYSKREDAKALHTPLFAFDLGLLKTGFIFMTVYGDIAKWGTVVLPHLFYVWCCYYGLGDTILVHHVEGDCHVRYVANLQDTHSMSTVRLAFIAKGMLSLQKPKTPGNQVQRIPKVPKLRERPIPVKDVTLFIQEYEKRLWVLKEIERLGMAEVILRPWVDVGKAGNYRAHVANGYSSIALRRTIPSRREATFEEGFDDLLDICESFGMKIGIKEAPESTRDAVRRKFEDEIEKYPNIQKHVQLMRNRSALDETIPEHVVLALGDVLSYPLRGHTLTQIKEEILAHDPNADLVAIESLVNSFL